MESDPNRAEVGTGYPSHQLAKAFVTALSHHDPEARRRAEGRIDRWQAVLRGMAAGKLRVGSRAPVTDLPIWATPEVVRGGFATGRAKADGELSPHEAAVADRVGLVRDRRAVFAHFLTEAGLFEVAQLLASGRYRVEIPEEAALLTVGWLVHAGDTNGALALVDLLEPYAGRLCFVPRPGGSPSDLSIVSRETVGQVGQSVARKRPNERVETMREALEIWNPFGDELLDLWLDSAVDGRVAVACRDNWRERASGLRERYESLAAAHRRCTKHRNAKENLGILVEALDELVRTGALDAKLRGLLQHAVDSMVRRRGRPGSAEHEALRASQAANAAVPAHHRVATIVVGRLAALPQDQGVRSTDDLALPVSADEAASTGVPQGTPIPLSIRAALARALAGPIEALVEAGVVPSSEVLARLVPQVAAATVAAAYPDEALQRLVAQNYLAFCNRRSLLLLNLEHQVRIDELPWVRALAGHRNSPGATLDEARAALQRLAELTIEGFPATVIPNPMVRELVALAREAELNVPFVEELAADIFMGTFSVKFLAAAKVAAEQLAGTAYERYYAIDYEAIRQLRIQSRAKELRSPASEEFAALCRRRSGYLENERWSVAANGTMIEQAQILTSQNLAALTGPVGLAARMQDQWPRLAERCFKRSEALVGKLTNNPRPLGTVKDAAYAWRQMIFYLSVADTQAREQFVAWSAGELDGAIPAIQERLRPALNGLVHVLSGGAFDEHGESPEGRRFLGWVVGSHWMLSTERLRRPS